MYHTTTLMCAVLCRCLWSLWLPYRHREIVEYNFKTHVPASKQNMQHFIHIVDLLLRPLKKLLSHSEYIYFTLYSLAIATN